MAEKIRVLIVDDHAVVRSGLISILRPEPDIEIIGEAGDGLQATNEALALKPDVIIMEIFSPRNSGLEALIAIKEKLPTTSVLIFTTSEREEDLLQALRFGAQGYLLKEAAISEVVDAVRRTAAGEAILSPRLGPKLVAEFREKIKRRELSARETEVVGLLGEGLTDGEIARRLFLSDTTVRTYLRRLLDKLHLKNRVEAAAYAGRYGLRNKPF